MNWYLIWAVSTLWVLSVRAHYHHPHVDISEASSEGNPLDETALELSRQNGPYMCYRCNGFLNAETNTVTGCYNPESLAESPDIWEPTDCYTLSMIIEDINKPLHKRGSRGVTCGVRHILRSRNGDQISDSVFM